VSLIPPSDEQGLGQGYHSPQVDVDVRLNTNESPLPPPAAWVEELQAEVGRIPFHRYPDRDATELRAAIGDLHGVEPGQVFCANGSNEVLQTLLLTYGGPGRTAAVFEPTYALHGHICRLTRTAVAEGERNDDFTLDLVEVKRVLSEHRPAVTFLCSPNNPTGRVEPRDVVAHVLELAPGLVVVDEAYGQFAAWSALSLMGEGRPVVVVRTFSKTWSMAAARLGDAFADDLAVVHDDRAHRRLRVRAVVCCARELQRAADAHASCCTSRRYERGRSSKPKIADAATSRRAPRS